MLWKVSGLEEARSMPGVMRVTYNAKPGDRFQRLESSDSRQEFILATESSVAMASQALEAALAKIKLEIDEL